MKYPGRADNWAPHVCLTLTHVCMSLSSEGENSATAPRIARAARAAAAQRAILCRHQTSKHYDAIQYYPDEHRRRDAPDAAGVAPVAFDSTKFCADWRQAYDEKCQAANVTCKAVPNDYCPLSN